MKLATTLLLTGLLVASASALSASDQPAVPDLQQAAQAPALGSPAVTAPSTSAPSCDPAVSSLVALPVAQAGVSASSLPCGSCSDSNCVGAPRGQICHLSGVNGGWGHCNIFSGGYMCATGGWECQCQAGPLP